MSLYKSIGVGLLVLALSSCGQTMDTEVLAKCVFFGPDGAPAHNLDESFSNPIPDAMASFKGNRLQVAVVRNRYGKTVSPLKEDLDPVRQEIAASESQADRIWDEIMPRIRGRYAFLLLQADVKPVDGHEGQANFLDVPNPCFDQRAYSYAAQYNTQMLRMIYRQSGLSANF